MVAKEEPPSEVDFRELGGGFNVEPEDVTEDFMYDLQAGFVWLCSFFPEIVARICF